jgi:D-alanine-D-alanine ligase
MKKAVILINKISANPLPDEQDVLEQAASVEKAMLMCGYSPQRVYFDLNLEITWKLLLKLKPDVVFNLVETVGGRGELIHLAPTLLECLEIPFTGSASFPIYLSSHKVLAKKRFTDLGLPTPDWYWGEKFPDKIPEGKYIVKPLWEDGSSGITDNSVFDLDASTFDRLQLIRKNKKLFLEEYIQGREFNISVIGGDREPLVLPPAEIRFNDYPEGKPHILNYASKWDEGSFDYRNSERHFDFAGEDASLIEKLEKISLGCWNGLEMSGYARFDFRIDQNNEPFLLEVNANPCLSPDAGFIAAAEKAGFDYKAVVERILADAFIKSTIA